MYGNPDDGKEDRDFLIGQQRDVMGNKAHTRNSHDDIGSHMRQ